jgi:TatD DNase family protein
MIISAKTMNLIDTHAHLYLPHFSGDIDRVIQNAADKNVIKILLPNIDLKSAPQMLELCKRYSSQCFPMLGLHPTSVKRDYRHQLSTLEKMAGDNEFVAIGETGMDAYWDTEFMGEQEASFITHLEWAKIKGLPVVIHSRETMDKILAIVKSHSGTGLRGVFHAFSGSVEQAVEIADMGFKIGLGGVVTYRNSGLEPVVRAVDLKNIVLETDSPYLTPAPHRGKRNESAYLPFIAEKIAELKGLTFEEVTKVTTGNACELFNLKPE